jgi:hypothetical protein
VVRGLIVFDAFTSDAIPVHLVTREAVQLYFEKIREDGVLAFNVTNRYVDLSPVLGAVARDLGVHVRGQGYRVAPEEEFEGKQSSVWIIMARRPEHLGPLHRDPRWGVPIVPDRQRAWTDDYSNLIGAMRFGG